MGTTEPLRSRKPGSSLRGESAAPLCVDLDGTLIRTDMLWETLLRVIKEKPWSVFLVPFWLLRGREWLKRRLAERADFDPECLPYCAELCEYLREQRNSGRKLILATASDQLVAERINAYLGVFDEVMGSGPEVNLKGRFKLARLQERFPQGFDYAGDSTADLQIFRAARRAIVVNASRHVQQAAAGAGNLDRIFSTSAESPWRRLVRAMRIHQWAKNLLVFVPVITSHRLFEMSVLLPSALIFIAFNLCASAVYVINDLVDLEADRSHSSKRLRPFAAGTLPIPAGIVLIPALLAGTAGIVWLLPPVAAVVMAAYFSITLAYSLYLKRMLLVDVFALSALYTIRIAAGTAATGIHLSAWLLTFSIFLFLSLAFAKRASELRRLRDAGACETRGRAYRASDLDQVNTFGVTSGFLAALVFALYINSEAVAPLYRHPGLLWVMCPLILYWIARIWILSWRGDLHEDPILFAIKDPATYYAAVLAGLVLAVASRDWPGLRWLRL